MIYKGAVIYLNKNLISKNLEYSHLLSFRKNYLRIRNRRFIDKFENKIYSYVFDKKLTSAYKFTVQISGWTDNIQLLERLDSNTKKLLIRRKDLKRIKGAKKFKIRIIPNSPKYSNLLLKLFQLRSISPVKLENVYSQNINGYFDGIFTQVKIDFKFSRIFSNLRDFIFIKRFISVCQYWNFLNLHPNEVTTIFHEFHQRIYDNLCAEFKGENVLIPLFGLNLTEFFLSNISIKSKSRFICAKCNKDFDLSFLEIFEPHDLTEETNPLTDISEVNKYWSSITKARIQENRLVSTDSDKLVFSDPGMKFASKFISDLGHFIVFNNSVDSSYVFARKRSPNTIKVKSAVLFALVNQNNWYHVIIEYLSLSPFLINELDPETVILVPFKTNANIVEMIKILYGHEIVFIDFEKCYEIDKLYVPRKVSWIDDTPLDTYCKVNFRIDSKSTKNFRDLLPQKSGLSSNDARLHNRNIAFLRNPLNSNSKVLLNYGDVVSLLQSNSFEVYDPALLSLSQQYTICQSAKNLVVQGGSGVVSLLFLIPKTKVFLINSSRAKHWAVFRRLAKILDLELVEIYSKISLRNMFTSVTYEINQPYYANIKSIKSYLSRV